ncbi:hypothetical protein JCM14469_16070 [Desulfatiferula olefinivorans]
MAERYAPAFAIMINGREVPREVSAGMVSLSVTDTSDRADSFAIRISDRHHKQGRFAGGAALKWMDSSLFDEGNEVMIQMGYVNDMTVTFSGEITAVSAAFPAGGSPELTVRGFCLLHRLQRRRRTRAFEAATASGIAREIARDMGLAATVDETAFEHPHNLSEDETYASILAAKARPIAFEVTVKGKTLYFVKPRYLTHPDPDLVLEWGRDLGSFTPAVNTYTMTTEVRVRASQTSQGGGKDALVGVAGAGDERVSMGKKTASLIAREIFGDNPVRLIESDVSSQEEARDIALAQLEARSLDFITASGTVIGRPDISARKVVAVRGVGRRYSGNYYLTSVTHTIDAGGYRTQFQVKRNGR